MSLTLIDYYWSQFIAESILNVAIHSFIQEACTDWLLNAIHW